MSKGTAQDNLTCPVCIQLFNNPKCLPYYHSYCKGFLEKMQVESKPECRKEAKVPAGGVKEFATDFFINQPVDDLKKVIITSDKEVIHNECDEDDSVVPDHDCISLLPHASIESRKCQKADNFIPFTESNTPTTRAITKCKEHDYELKHYCELCEELVCLYCTMMKHKSHKHDITKNINCSIHWSQIEAAITPVNPMIQDLSDAQDKIKKMLEKIQKQGEDLNNHIDQHYDELVKKLMKQKDKVKQRVRDTVSQKEKALTTQLDEMNSTQAELVKIKELNDALITDQEMLSAKKQVINGMRQLIDKFNTLSKNPVQLATMKFVPNINTFPEFGSFFDIHASEVANLPKSIILGQEIEVIVITKDSNGDHCFIGGDHVSVKLTSFTGNVTIGEVRDNNDGTYNTSFVSEQVGEAKLQVFINDQEIEKSPYSVVVRNYHLLKLPDKIVDYNGQLDEPFGIAFSRNGIWATTDRFKNCVYVLDNHDQLLRMFGSSGRNNGQFNGPRGIAFDSDNHLYVVDKDNHRVQKFDVTGTYLLQFGEFGSHPGQLKNPCGITTHIDMVYVADYSNHRISVFQCNGQFCSCLSSDQIAFPYDAVVNTNGQLLVANCHCISTFSLKDQKYIGKFGTRGSNEGQFKKPYSIATDVHGFILVTDCNHRVSIFDHLGNFVHCFGSHGSAKGQFIRPHAVALSPRGCIYISDTHNKRIQIFSHY